MGDGDDRSSLASTERSVSSVIGVMLLVAIVVLLAVVLGTLVFDVGEDGVDSAVVHTQVHYDIETSEDDELLVRPNAVSQGETDLVLSINGEEITTWDGRDTIRIECLYPNDRVTLTSETEDGRSTALIEEFYFDQATSCPQYNTFPEKFKYAVVDGEEHVINDRYAFGLSIVPNGTDRANDEEDEDDDGTDRGRNLGKISLANEWQHVQLYTNRSIGGFEPPVFLLVLVDNVHWEDVPDPDVHDGIGDTHYDWDDSPPDIPIGTNAYTFTNTGIEPRTEPDETQPDDAQPDETEPTNDVFMAFKPGCDRSKLHFIEENAGYNNQIYLNDELIIPDTNEAEEGETFDAPGVDCPGGVEW